MGLLPSLVRTGTFHGNIVPLVDGRGTILYTTHMQPTTSGEDLIDKLETLRNKLNALRERLENSGVERTVGIRNALGNDCRFFRKSVSLFLERDYLELKTLIKDASDLFDVVEG